MRFKTSNSARKFGFLFLGLAVLSVVIGIFDVITKDQNWLMNFILMIICAVLWVVCGIIALLSSKKLKEAESKKAKINAFNYAKVRKKK